MSEDLEGLRLILRQLFGRPYLFLRPSYAGEVTFHLGTPRPSISTRLNKPYGSYVLTTRGSTWVLSSEGGELLDADLFRPDSSAARKIDAEEIQSLGLIGTGALVVAATPFPFPTTGGIGLVLAFDDGARLVVFPDSSADDGGDGPEPPQVADRELFTHSGAYLRVGPGKAWNYAVPPRNGE